MERFFRSDIANIRSVREGRHAIRMVPGLQGRSPRWTHCRVQQNERRFIHENGKLRQNGYFVCSVSFARLEWRRRDILWTYPNPHEPHSADQCCRRREAADSVRCCQYWWVPRCSRLTRFGYVYLWLVVGPPGRHLKAAPVYIQLEVRMVKYRLVHHKCETNLNIDELSAKKP